MNKYFVKEYTNSAGQKRFVVGGNFGKGGGITPMGDFDNKKTANNFRNMLENKK